MSWWSGSKNDLSERAAGRFSLLARIKQSGLAPVLRDAEAGGPGRAVASGIDKAAAAIFGMRENGCYRPEVSDELFRSNAGEHFP